MNEPPTIDLSEISEAERKQTPLRVKQLVQGLMERLERVEAALEAMQRNYEQLSLENQQLRSENQQLGSENQQLRTENQQFSEQVESELPELLPTAIARRTGATQAEASREKQATTRGTTWTQRTFTEVVPSRTMPVHSRPLPAQLLRLRQGVARDGSAAAADTNC